MALALAIPAWSLTTWSFSPLDYRASLNGRDERWTFQLHAPAWLFLESDLTVRTDSGERPQVIASVNAHEVARFQPVSLFVGERFRTLIPLDAVRAGTNQLHLRIVGAEAAGFTMNLRLQNYRGINPRFPRAAVVADEAVAHDYAARGPLLRFLDFVIIGGILAFAVWLVDGITAPRLGSSAVVILASPVAVLWAALTYSVMTPLHLWLYPEALATLVVGPALVSAIALSLRRHRRVLLRLALSAAATLGLMEIGFRAFNWIAPTPIFYTESYGRYRGQPGAPFLDTHLNAAGFNDVDRRPSKPPGVHRIVAIGDSVTFGIVPRRHNFVTVLESELQRRRPTEVLNLGVPGTAPNDYLAILVEEGLSYSPDVVLVGFFIGNDFESRARRWYEHSYTATFAQFLWRLGTSAGEGATWFEAMRGSYDDNAATFGPERFLEIEVSRADIYVEEALLLDAATRAVAYLAEMRDIAARAGAELLVVLIPDEVQVDPALQRQVTQAHRAPVEQFDFHRPNRVMAELLSGRGVEFIDLLPVFRGQSRDHRLYKPQDTHWNIAGNRLAAEALARYLTSDRP